MTSPKTNRTASLLFLLTLVLATVVHAAPALEPESATASVEAPKNTGIPLWELGIGMGAAIFPHYPGSDQSKLYLLPFPFGFYRGKFIQSDKKGMRARLFTAKSFDISVSGSGAFPIKANENRARIGMPDLGTIGQAGPKLRFELFQTPDGGALRAGFSVRTVITATDLLKPNHRGTVYEPELVYTKASFIGDQVDLYTSLRATFGSRGTNTYFYHVKPSEATADRPAYNAKPGLTESVATLGLNLRSQDSRHRWFLSGDVMTLEGAANRESSLIKSRLNTSIALAYIWTFFESEEKAVIIY